MKITGIGYRKPFKIDFYMFGTLLRVSFNWRRCRITKYFYDKEMLEFSIKHQLGLPDIFIGLIKL